jgi:signal transduction histidine kinase
MLPVIWQWIVTAAAMVLVPVLLGVIAAASYGYFQLLCILLCSGAVLADVATVLYGGWCFGMLLKGIETMSRGNLNHKIDTRYLYGSFKEFGEELNSLAEAAKQAAEKQMKSERMKTELITNVSHDIKTPLTSIINFVDLMKKPHTEAEGEEYLDVLDRQSQRLKKLIDDLMDMSKASSGNISVELGQVDAAEAINQALGEFADKLDRVNLTPVFRYPDKTIHMVADGKLLWRVLSNLLNNAVKYALPDTRLYVDLMELQGTAMIAIKNISREQLNVNADELMERFVRGDASRNTEGSGLGLNIAKSLVEIQGGQMHLMVDGDLFKVTLIFPQK